MHNINNGLTTQRSAPSKILCSIKHDVEHWC